MHSRILEAYVRVVSSPLSFAPHQSCSFESVTSLLPNALIGLKALLGTVRHLELVYH